MRDGFGDESGAKLIEQRGIDFAPSEDFCQSLNAAVVVRTGECNLEMQGSTYPAFRMVNAEPGGGEPPPYGESPALWPRSFSAATPGLAVLDCSLKAWMP